MKRRAAFAKGLLPSYRVGPFFLFFFFRFKKKRNKKKQTPQLEKNPTGTCEYSAGIIISNR